MITITHIVTKKLEKGWERLVFEIENTSEKAIGGELFFELYWMLGAVYNVNDDKIFCVLPQTVKRFTIDLEVKHSERWSKFRFSILHGGILTEGKGKKNRNRENLTDVVRVNKIETNKKIGCLKWY